MGLTIQKMDGRTYDLESLGIHETERLLIGFPNSETSVEPIEGGEGVVDGETFLRDRPIKASLVLLADRLDDMPHKRNELFRLFDAREKFFLMESREPGKRWLVKCTSPYAINESATIGRFALDFTSFKPYSESVMIYKQEFDENTFRFLNGGEKIDMKTQIETEIEFSGVSSSLTIKNKTTGENWVYNGTTGALDIILLKGVRSFKNGSSIFGETNKKLLSIAPGWNEFEVTGATNFNIEIRTRFYFL